MSQHTGAQRSTRTERRRARAVAGLAMVAAFGLVAASCSGDDEPTSTTMAAISTSASEPELTAAPTSGPATTEPRTTPAPTTVPAATEPATTAPATTVAGGGESDSAALMLDVVTQLASDEFGGRNENTTGWELSQEYLVGQLEQFSEPIDGKYLHPAVQNVNILGVIPGTDLADEYVVIGAHYDHLGDGDCSTDDPTNTICNGANDNAAGVAVALAAARAVVEAGGNRRSILVGLWDREEDGLLGSAGFLTTPAVPLENIVGYLNFDIQGANLLPSLRTSTVMVGAETGGPPLIDAAKRATTASSLNTVPLSLIFGQGRSDHAVFVEAGIPSVFFTDANNGCYHTTYDELAIVDFGKLDQQLLTATALLTDLASTDDVPRITTGLPLATFDDAVAMLSLTEPAMVDATILPVESQEGATEYNRMLQAIVAEGPDAFDDADVATVLGGAAALVDALAQADCDGYLD